MPDRTIDPHYLGMQMSRLLSASSERRAEAFQLIAESKRAPIGSDKWWLHRIAVPARLDRLRPIAERHGWKLDVETQAPIELIADVIEYMPVEQIELARGCLLAAETKWRDVLLKQRQPLGMFLEMREPTWSQSIRRTLHVWLPRLFSAPTRASATSIPCFKLLCDDPNEWTQVGEVSVVPNDKAEPIRIAYLRRPYISSTLTKFERPRVVPFEGLPVQAPLV
jgi:hypothetical protein